MITVQINFENEQALAGTAEDMMKQLSPEAVEKLTFEVLLKYFTDSVDYGKQKYIEEKIKEIREHGLKNSSSYYSRTKEQIDELSDVQVQQLDGWRDIMRNYKSPKESLFDKIHKLLEEKLDKYANEFVKSDNNLKEVITKHEEVLVNNYPEIVKTVLSQLMYGYVQNTLMQASYNPNMSQAVNDIREILNRNGLR